MTQTDTNPATPDDTIDYPQMYDAFPYFDQHSLPPIPPSWTDVSWHNDLCPSFETDKGHIVFIDYAASYQRDTPDGPRFSAHTADNCQVNFVDEVASDDWNTILEWTNK